MNSPKGLIIHPLLVRPMIAGDIDAVLAIERRSKDAPHWQHEDYLACTLKPDTSALRRMGLIGEWNEEVAGFAVLRCLKTSAGNEAELESIVVAPGLRQQGVGSALIASAIHLAREQGAERVDLEVRASNAAAARLYERCGFAETARRRGYYRDPGEDAVLMSFTL